MIVQQHRDILDLWAALGGIPDDEPTRDWVCGELVLKLWAAYLEVEQTMSELAGLDIPKTEDEAGPPLFGEMAS